MADDAAPVPTGPGQGQSWSSGAKDAVTTSLSGRVWATVGRGIVTEVFWPAVDQPQVKDFGFLVRDVAGAQWRELKAVGEYSVASHEDPAVPLARIDHLGDFYRFSFETVPDPEHDALLVSYALTPLPGQGPRELRLYPLLAPHLGTSTANPGPRYGTDNAGWSEDGALYARDGAGAHVLCLLADPGFAATSVGWVGESDGWTDLHRHGEMAWKFTAAGPGVVALTGELIAPEGTLSGSLALGFGPDPAAARAAAQAALDLGADAARVAVIDQWQKWSARLSFPPEGAALSPAHLAAVRQSATVLHINEDRQVPGAVVAGLATPWGDETNDAGGYHMVWCRDSCESALALAALGDLETGIRLLDYLAQRQGPDGSWARCYFLDGTALPGGVQLDEVAFPLLLAAKLTELGADLPPSTPAMVQRAAGWLVQNGPTGVDRWEETPGTSPFALALTVVALVSAAARSLSEPDRSYALSVADNWNERLEEFTYVSGDVVDRAFSTAGHYVRIGEPADQIRLGNQPSPDGRDVSVPADLMVGLEFLYLPRLGLRDPADRRIADTLNVVDRMLRTTTPSGDAFLRYDMDGYGEWIDGSGWPVRGFGVGRPWPLLAGERGHHDVLTGVDPTPRLDAMLAMRGRGGLLPEQVWDAGALPWRNLVPGAPTGSAMPLAWAHSELIKLAVTATIGKGRPVERLDVVESYYPDRAPRQTTVWHWRSNGPVRLLPAGCTLAVEDSRPFTLHYGLDQWQQHSITDRHSSPSPFGVHAVSLTPDELSGHTSLQFTLRYDDGTWEGTDQEVVLDAPRPDTGTLPLPPREYAGRAPHRAHP